MTKHKWHKEIKAWADGAEIEIKYTSGAGSKSGWMIVDRHTDWDFEHCEYRIKPQGTKCITKDCENHTNEGKFVGELCGPCWDYIVNGKGVHSQAYRNAQPKEPKYLYVYENVNAIHVFTTGNIFVPSDIFHKYIGKIKLEVEDD